jgi:hypothetical protein
MLSTSQAGATFRSTPSARAAGDALRLRRGRSLPLTTVTRSHAPAAFAAMRTAAQCAAIQQLPKSCAMAKATHTTILAVCYFLTPLALCVGLVVIGTFTGSLASTNLLIAIVILCGIFVGLTLILFRKYRINALMLICTVSLIASCYWYFVGQDRIRRYLYVAEIMAKPHFDEKCVPPDGILFNGDTLRLCSVHDFDLAGWVDLIFKIDGSYPAERLIADLTSGGVTPAVGNELSKLGEWSYVFGLRNTVTDQHLVADYYLIRVHMCGNASPSC